MEMTIVTQVVFGSALAWKELQKQNSPCLSPSMKNWGWGWAIDSIQCPVKFSGVKFSVK